MSEPAAPSPVRSRRTTILAALAAPLLLSAFPILAMYASNANDLVPGQLRIPLLVAAGAAALLVVAFAALLRDVVGGGSAAALVIVLALSYGGFADLLVAVPGVQLGDRHLVAVAVVLAGYIVFLVRRLGPAGRGTLARVLAGVGAMLVAYNTFSVTARELHKARAMQGQRSSLAGTAAQSAAPKPDIYVIVLDEFASLSTIRDQWGYDNSALAGFLEERGFQVAGEARTRYSATLFCLAGLLNMDYPGPPISNQEFWDLSENEKVSQRYRDPAELVPMLRSSKVMTFSQSLGYRVVTINNARNMDPACPAYVPGDVEFAYSDEREGLATDGFTMLLARQSLLRPLTTVVEQRAFGILEKQRNVVLFTLRKLRESTQLPSPKVVYAHVLCPHWPFIFDETGAQPPRELADNWRHKAGYLGQYKFISREMRELVTFLTQGDSDRVIMIFSDHGPRPTHSAWAEDNLKVGEEFPIEDMFKVFNAIRAPRMAPGAVGPDMAIVNNFRVIFNAYFGTSYPLVANR